MNPALMRRVSPEALSALVTAEKALRLLPEPPEGETWRVEEVATVVAFFIPGAVVRGGLSSGFLHAWVRVPDSPGHWCILDPCTRNRLPQVQLVGPGDPSYRDEREGAWRPPREDVLAGLLKTLTERGMTRES